MNLTEVLLMFAGLVFLTVLWLISYRIDKEIIRFRKELCDLRTRYSALFSRYSAIRGLVISVKRDCTIKTCNHCLKKIICENITDAANEDYNRFVYKTCMRDSCKNCDRTRRNICTSYAAKENLILKDTDSLIN